MEKMRYGTTYSLADFCDRLVPKHRHANNKLLKETFEGLKRLSIVQNTNAWVTMQATLTAGVWIHYKGRPYCLINPAKNFLRVGAAHGNQEAIDRLSQAFEDLIASKNIIAVENVKLSQWRFPPTSLFRLWEFFEQSDKPETSDEVGVVARHPRTFSGEDRQAALEDFVRKGRICPGVGALIPAHKIEEDDRIEYDHVLPYARGGATTYQNLAILCVACNRAKGATAR